MTMEISRRTDYAIRLIAALVDNGSRPLSVRKAAEQNEVPYAFARNIQHDLVQVGLLKSIRGAQGGMLLAVDPSTLTLLQVIEAVQGPLSVAICANDEEWCSRMQNCKFHRVWENANILLHDYLDSVNIQQLLESRTKAPRHRAHPDGEHGDERPGGHHGEHNSEHKGAHKGEHCASFNGCMAGSDHQGKPAHCKKAAAEA